MLTAVVTSSRCEEISRRQASWTLRCSCGRQYGGQLGLVGSGTGHLPGGGPRLNRSGAGCGVEDSRAVEAGRAAVWLVVGVDRVGQTDELQNAVPTWWWTIWLCSSPEKPTISVASGGPRSHRLRAAATRLLAADDFPSMSIVWWSGVSTRIRATDGGIFALANGYLGIRGTQDEGRPSYDRRLC